MIDFIIGLNVVEILGILFHPSNIFLHYDGYNQTLEVFNFFYDSYEYQVWLFFYLITIIVVDSVSYFIGTKIGNKIPKKITTYSVAIPFKMLPFVGVFGSLLLGARGVGFLKNIFISVFVSIFASILGYIVILSGSSYGVFAYVLGVVTIFLLLQLISLFRKQ